MVPAAVDWKGEEPILPYTPIDVTRYGEPGGSTNHPAALVERVQRAQALTAAAGGPIDAGRLLQSERVGRAGTRILQHPHSDGGRPGGGPVRAAPLGRPPEGGRPRLALLAPGRDAGGRA